MSLETGTFIDDLVSTNPVSATDLVRYGAGHLRLLKTALKNSFAGTGGAVMVAGVDAGTVNAIVITPTPALTEYTTRMLVVWHQTTSNTGATTINISGLGAKSVVSVANAALASGDLVAGRVYVGIYDDTSVQLEAVTKNYVDQLAFSTALPAQTGNSGKYLTTNGTSASWSAIPPPLKPGMAAGKYYTYPFVTTMANAFVAANRLYAVPVYVSETNTFSKIGMEVTTGLAGNARVGIYNIDTDGLPSTLVLDAGTFTTNAAAEKEVTISQSLSHGWYYLAFVSDVAVEVRAAAATGAGAFVLGGQSSLLSVGTAYAPYVALTYGALPASFGTATIVNMTTAHPLVYLKV